MVGWMDGRRENWGDRAEMWGATCQKKSANRCAEADYVEVRDDANWDSWQDQAEAICWEIRDRNAV